LREPVSPWQIETRVTVTKTLDNFSADSCGWLISLKRFGLFRLRGGWSMRQKKNDRMKMGTVRSTIRMLIPLDKQSEAIEILGSVTAQTLCEQGCISSRLYRGVDEIRAIMVEEFWMSHEDILHHLQSDEFHRVLLAIEMSEELPEIRFDTISQSNGVETIEKARQQA
jgi:quinol monooxygenase YgiN